MNIEHISVSRMSVWEECQQKYKFHYHLKVPLQGEEPFYFVYGKVIHKIAEEYVRRGDPNLFAEVVSDVLAGRVEIEPNKFAPKVIPRDYSRRMVGHLKHLKNLTTSIGGWDNPGSTEYKFRYDLNPPHENFATGFIDRIICRDDKFFIIDYKTTKPGSYRKNERTILKDLQLRMYAKVIQKEYGAKAENIRACLYYLEGGNMIGATYSQASLDAAEDQMREAYRQIEGTNPASVQGKVGEHCRRCDFRKICPTYSIL